jgi:hypothetical protein
VDKKNRSTSMACHCWLILLCLLALLLGCRNEREPKLSPALYDPPLPNGGSIFFVGNSFFGWEGRNLPEWVRALGQAQGVPFTVGGDIVPGDLPLSDFLRHPAIQRALASRGYKVWVLQGHELEPVDHPQEFKQAVRDFNRAITAAGGKAVLFMTWEFRWRRFLPEVADAYESIGQELGIPVIPAGLVYWDCGRSPPGNRGPFFLTASPEHPDGDLHENALGSAVDTYVTYSILTGRNPLGQAFTAPGNTISLDLLKYLSDHAWDRAALRLRSASDQGRSSL